ncbi:peptidylprolyl isomerase [Alkalilimnicola ehrlichii]|uniref:Peptidyl-prolyl cis-trans isomerase n=1 Tax=Alkalilimnicola ehrlichii TaxID=351052 RepID=A0A3E0WN99_9GAMM|nr:peptidylprolyl isomerase [Alkalilimnicola ehrlichii]RFA27345.1 peptidylprolyl isomerase [Alkalilimnicola ehrlichii]RFA34450.1 peptidylprolyl isomerase [Alkalilimnicola ehrlichii]
MEIAKDCVVQFHYSLKNSNGVELETSHGGSPMAYLHGHNNVIPGLEEAMAGRNAGDTFSVTVPPEKGYGEFREGMLQRVPVKHLQGAKRWRPGMVAQVSTDKGPRAVRVVKVGRFMAEVDFNHPLAGQELTFDVEVVAVRAARSDEIAHGHAHGEGGHQH